jgi:Multicopper oxidase
MQRREFLKYGGAGAVALGLGRAAFAPESALAALCQGGATYNLTLTITDKAVEMVDGEWLNMLAFSVLNDPRGARVPGRVLRVKEGAVVNITVFNSRPEPHGFEITGIPDSKIPSIDPGTSRCVSFVAPAGGTYMYHDASYGPVYRVLGLHGAFIVEPKNGGVTPAGSATPYSQAKLTPAVRSVMDAFGSHERFPGEKWKPAPSDQEYSDFEKIWVFSQTDPKFNEKVEPEKAILPNSLMDRIVDNWLPRYFTLNGRSGFYIEHDGDDAVPANYIGEPTLLRVLNAGLVQHAAHIHGNHIFDLACAGPNGEVVVHDNVWERDVWPMAPMERRDVLLPYEVPPDIPRDFPASMKQEPFPLRYVMHCHTEMSQTAAGGNYPQGLVAHFEIRGPLGGRQRLRTAAR